MQDLALLRASLDNCESFSRLAGGEYALSLTVPLGPLRAHYEVRAHVASDNGTLADKPHRTLNFKARAAGLGSLRGQIGRRAARGRPSAGALERAEHADRLFGVGYVDWAARGIAGAPDRNALHELADDFFTEFCAVVQAKHGQGPNLARGAPPRRQHVFLRPISLAGVARRARHDHGGALTGRAVHSTFGARAHHEPTPHVVPHWAWAAMIFFVALLLYVARWFSGN